MGVLYIMVGPPACGKSTLAKEMSNILGTVTISSDAVREELYGDESVQKDHDKVFAICHARMRRALRKQNVVFDATNIAPKHRISLVQMAKAEGNRCDEVVGIVYDGDLNLCLERNAGRKRKVPEGVIRNMYDTLKRFPPDFDEGFDALVAMSAMRKRIEKANSDIPASEMAEAVEYILQERCPHCKHRPGDPTSCKKKIKRTVDNWKCCGYSSRHWDEKLEF